MFFCQPWCNDTEDQTMDQEEDDADNCHQDPQGCIQWHQREQFREKQDQRQSFQDQTNDHTRFPSIDLAGNIKRYHQTNRKCCIRCQG